MNARRDRTSTENASLHERSHADLVKRIFGASFYVRRCSWLERGRAKLLVATPPSLGSATAHNLGRLLSEISRARVERRAAVKWLVLFVLDLAAVVCALRALSLTFSVDRVYVAPNRTRAAWDVSEAAGFLIVGCFCALAALLVSILM
jgi:hypothetical protein